MATIWKPGFFGGTGEGGGTSNHEELNNLTSGDAGHTQFTENAGRTGGQNIRGGKQVTDELGLRGNTINAKGIVIDANGLPIADEQFTPVDAKTLVHKYYVDSKERSAGILSEPTLVDNGDGTGTFSAVECMLFSVNNFTGALLKYSISEATLSFTDAAEEYVCIHYNGGVPEYYVETDFENINASNVALVFIIWREGNYLHSSFNGDVGNGLANKIHRADLLSTPYRRSSFGGLMLTETTTPNPRTIKLSEGIVFAGSTPNSILAFDSSADKFTRAIRTGDTWSYTDELVYNNTQINPAGTGLVDLLNNNRFGVRWFYRSIGDIKQIYYVLGETDHKSFSEAEKEAPRSDLPLILIRHSMLVGRSIIQKNTTSGTITSAFTQTFTGTQVMPHNETTGIEGGDSVTPHYYHSDQAINTTDSPSWVEVTASGIPIAATHEATKDPTGFTNCDNITVTYNSTAKTITLTGTFQAYWRGRLVTALTNGWVSDPISGTPSGKYFLYYNGTSFVWSQDLWTFDTLQIAYVYYTVAGAFIFAQRECHGFMGHDIHEELHYNIGTYLRSGGDLSGITLNSTTVSVRRPDTSSTLIEDEDLETILPAKTDKLYNLISLSGAAVSAFSLDKADIVALNGAIPYYNSFSTPNWVQTPMSANQYMCLWKIAIPVTSDAASQKYRYAWIQGQQQGSLASQQALTPQSLNLGTLTSFASEFTFINKVIIRYTANNWIIVQVDKLTGNRSNFVATIGGYLSSVTTDTSLIGAGTAASPLGINGTLIASREYADNAAALAANLVAGEFYRTGDVLKVVHA